MVKPSEFLQGRVLSKGICKCLLALMNLQERFDRLEQYLVCEVILHYSAHRQLSEKDELARTGSEPQPKTLNTSNPPSRFHEKGPLLFCDTQRLLCAPVDISNRLTRLQGLQKVIAIARIETPVTAKTERPPDI